MYKSPYRFTVYQEKADWFKTFQGACRRARRVAVATGQEVTIFNTKAEPVAIVGPQGDCRHV